MDLPSHRLELLVVASLQGLLASTLELAQPLLDRRLVDPHDVVMAMGLDAEGLAQRGQQMILVHLAVSLDGIVLNVLRDVAQLIDRLLAQLFVGVCHRSSSVGSMSQATRRFRTWIVAGPPIGPLSS